jgi:hypothetical protein
MERNLDDKSKRTMNSNRVTIRNEEIKLDRQDSRVEGVEWGSWGAPLYSEGRKSRSTQDQVPELGNKVVVQSVMRRL